MESTGLAGMEHGSCCAALASSPAAQRGGGTGVWRGWPRVPPLPLIASLWQSNAMGLLGKLQKHKGKAKTAWTACVVVHTLAPFPGGQGPLCVTYERGSHSGATQPANPSRGSAAYVFEQQLVVSVTLYQHQVRVEVPADAAALLAAAAASRLPATAAAVIE